MHYDSFTSTKSYVIRIIDIATVLCLQFFLFANRARLLCSILQHDTYAKFYHISQSFNNTLQ